MWLSARTNKPARQSGLSRGYLALLLSIPGIFGTAGIILLDLNPPRGLRTTAWSQIWTYGVAVCLVLAFTSLISTPAAIAFGVLFRERVGGTRRFGRIIVAALILATLLTVIFVLWTLLILRGAP
jgi:hypothetical protein